MTTIPSTPTNNNCIVYALSLSTSPLDFRYIGRTSTTPSKRLSRHLSNSKKRTTHLHNWIRKHIALGDSILITPLEDSLTFKQSKTREIALIDHYKQLGFNLTNLTLGGEGALGAIRSPATRAKLSLALMGKTNSLGFKQTLQTIAKREATKKRNRELKNLLTSL